MEFLTRSYKAGVRRVFSLLYNEMAWLYDVVSWCVSLGQWRTWGKSALPHLLGPRVLEVAFGTGDILLDLCALGYEPFGIDSSPSMVVIAAGKLKKAGAEAALVRGMAQALPFREGTFDSIVLTFPPGLIGDRSALDEMARVLRPRGRLVIVDYAQAQRPRFLATLVSWLYALTGQLSEGGGYEVDWLRQLGWLAQEHEQQLPTGLVHILVAERTQ